ncbi:ATP-binding cassette domain-containing protein [Bacillus paralicheniformis]|uniref:ATP-binding cassette domain-containing protein n=1 Tax=Bacillus paralicheniformis TaxID=1648923 RepID=UPI00102D860F|nr:ABC transporter ATP-binding protein [Bacillus paralicheniformis]MBC8621174.1 ABC transporter ATP-binding protein [Robertmurraya crescens]MCJ8221355.1 ABC transporter ATP-binding protein [Bacillus paralicheniformis]MCW4365852.1 ABC transporter ATP-binding protein [Bacillus paralicheniformis]MEC2211781.1 ABC transporter ATP-binding protein [Bacillus paralicheniformis]MED1177231.1 ABC transporter ATP-binding protein [Bacillus paralicheniformis]
MIQLENISKRFDEKTVLSNFSIQIKENEFVSIVGKSGSGKTTVLNIMSLLDSPDKGDVTILGYTNPKAKEVMQLRREHLGYIFQNYVLMDNETVLTNLLLSTAYAKNFHKGQLPGVLEMVGLDKSFLKKKIYQLSGGEQQRVAIARILLKPCDIILADEPTGNLDEYNKNIVLSLFHRLKDMGKTIICVTHDQKIADCSDRVINLS